MVHPEMFTRESWDLFVNEGDTALVAVCGQADGEGCHCMLWGRARI